MASKLERLLKKLGITYTVRSVPLNPKIIRDITAFLRKKRKWEAESRNDPPRRYKDTAAFLKQKREQEARMRTLRPIYLR